LDFIEGEGLLEALITHEMGHVLGFGTLWPLQDLLADAAGDGGTDPHFIGAQAIASFDDAGGSSYTEGLKVPVENDGGPGTIDSHWRESIFGTELMTGFIDVGANPLSAISVAALADQGYTVDVAGADPFNLSLSGLRLAPGKRLRLVNDVRRLPIKVLDKHGRLRMLRR
jgi:Leishmanolysin